MIELLSRSDIDFIVQAKDSFIAINHSQTGEIIFDELKGALSVSESEVSRIFKLVNFSNTEKISFSEWLCALALCTKLSEKSVANLYSFLDLSNNGKIKIRHLEQAYRPHLFKLNQSLEFLT